MANVDLRGAIPVVGGRATINANVLPALNLAPLLTAWFGGQIVIENAATSLSADASVVTVNGVSTCFGLQRMTTVAALTQTNLTIAFHLETALGASNWHFGMSFPDLPLGSGTVADSPIDRIVFQSATLILAAADGVDPSGGPSVERGLNFVGAASGASVGGMPIPIGAGTRILGILTPALVGVVTPRQAMGQFPWDAQPAPPGIALSALLGESFNLGPLALSDAILMAYSPLTEDWAEANPSYPPVLAFQGTIGSGTSAEVHITAMIDDSGRLALIGDFDAFTLSRLADVAHLSGPGDMLSSLPDPLRELVAAAGQLQLESVSLGGSVSSSGFTFDFANLRVGYPNLKWSIWDSPALAIDSLAVDFTVYDPLGAGRSVNTGLVGTMTVGGAELALYASAPNVIVCAELLEETTLPLHALFADLGLPAPPDLTIDTLQMFVVPGVSTDLTCTMADDPGWTLDLGFLKLTVAHVAIDVSKPHAGGATAAVSGALLLWDGDIALDVAYEMPAGAFQASGRMTEVPLAALWQWLAGDRIEFPFGDITLEQPYAAVTVEDGQYSLQATTLVDGFGELALSTRKRDGQTGVAFGIVISDPGAPQLGFIGDILEAVNLEKLVLVVSSLDDTGFNFADLAVFNVPSFPGKGVKLPPHANGVVKGVNLYAQLGTAGDRGLGALFALFGIDVDGTLGVTLSISTPDARANSKLMISFHTNKIGLDFDGELGLLMSNGVLGAFVEAKAVTSIQGRTVTFDVSAAVFESGVLLSGTMEGTVDLDTIAFGPATLSDLALMLGADFAGVPSLGFAAQLTVANFDSSLAVFLDSVNPTQSMFAGAVSGLSLPDVVETFTHVSVPSELKNVLPFLSLKGLFAFDAPAAGLVDALNRQDHPAVAAALNAHNLNLGPTINDFHIIVRDGGRHWFIAQRGSDGDGRPMPHYELTLDGAVVTVKLEPQIYLVPGSQTVQIGTLSFPPGGCLVAEIDSPLLKAEIDIHIDISRGISADVQLAPITLFSADFFAITDESGSSGPFLSLATFTQDDQTDPDKRPPHLHIEGKLRLLGIDISSTKLAFSPQGLSFTVHTAGPLREFIGVVDPRSLGNMHAQGAVTIGFDKVLSGGPLGDLHIQTEIDANLAILFNGMQPGITVSGSFHFMGLSINLPMVSFSASVLGDIPDQIQGAVGNAIFGQLRQMMLLPDGVAKIASQLASTGVAEVKEAMPLFHKIGANTQDIIKAVTSAYHLDPQGSAQALFDLGLSPAQAGMMLQMGLGMTDIAVANALHLAGIATTQVAGALKDAFNLQAEAAATVLNAIGLPGDEVAGALKTVYDVPIDAMASILNKTFNITGDAAKTILGGAGYAADQVEGWFSNAGSTILDGLKSIF